MIGWIIEWMIDWLYWRRKDNSASTAKFASDAGVTSSIQESAVEQRIVELQRALDASQHDNDELRRQLVTLPSAEVQPTLSVETAKKDDLTRIYGIGPVYEGRLNEFGIHTFADLANAPFEKLQEIIASADWSAVDIASWQDEAAKLDKESRDPQAKGA
ncbi:hypothetical protein KFU94_48020 [Chloroflexi bacterium TSY]|nr:hypothetical protein [Chloroflexi bacterium TSY]